MKLADLGADVDQDRGPRSGGDVGRYVPPYQQGEDSLFFETFNRNKKSVSLDLRTPRPRGVRGPGGQVRRGLLQPSRRPTGELRLTYDDLREVNPRIVCCSLSGFGMTGPRARRGAATTTSCRRWPAG